MRTKAVVLILLCAACAVIAEDWPQWRGTEGDGISKEKNWSASTAGQGKVLWKKDVGEGYSGVAVVKEHVYTMGNKDGKDTVVCLNAKDGSEAWSYSYPCGSSRSYPGPRCTPAVDIESSSVYVLSREGVLYCLDATKSGEKWKKDLKAEYGAKAPKWAFSSSPRVIGDTVLINAGARGIALNKKTGAKIWTGGPGVGGYSTPTVYSKDGKQYVAIFSAKNAYGLSLKTGAVAWSYPWETSYDVNAADPVVIGNEAFLSSGYNKGCVLLDIRAKAHPVWENKVIRSHFGSFVVNGGMLYGIDGQAGNKKASLKCVDFKTGDQKWAEPVGFGALSAADDKLIFLGESGKLVISEMSPAAYKEVSSTQLQLRGKCWTMPVLSCGKIYCRSVGGDLLCVDAGK